MKLCKYQWRMGHFQIYHNTLFCPSKILHKHCFQFVSFQEKLKTMRMQNFGGTKKSIMVNLKVAYTLCPFFFQFFFIVNVSWNCANISQESTFPIFFFFFVLLKDEIAQKSYTLPGDSPGVGPIPYPICPGWYFDYISYRSIKMK